MSKYAYFVHRYIAAWMSKLYDHVFLFSGTFTHVACKDIGTYMYLP